MAKNYNFTNLVFEGGGVKGIAYVGALQELEQRKILGDIVNVAGTSAGAITALLLALGYSVNEVDRIMKNLDFSMFVDNSFGFLTDTLRLIRKFGWNKGKNFYRWVGHLIKTKTGNANLTFKQLHELKDSQADMDIKDLFVVGTNLSSQRSEVYSYQTTPNMRIRDALRISMSIPLFFKSVKKKGKVFVDGGVTANYPIHLFDEDKHNEATLGFRLDSRDEIEYAKKGWLNVPKKIKNIKDYAFALISFMLESANKTHISKKDWNRTIFIDTLGVKTTDFGLDERTKRDLIRSGKVGVQEYFKWRDSLKK